MFDFLFRNKRSPIAIDIGADSIKMLQMHKVAGAVSVCACGRWRFPSSFGGDPAQRRLQTAAAIRDILRSSAFQGRRVMTAFNARQLGIKNIRLPHMPDHDMAEAVKWEAKERFSFEVGPDQLKYLNAGQIRTGGETRDEIIMMAVPQEVVEDHLSMLHELGLTPDYIEAEPVALFRTFERFLRRRADEQAVSIILNVGRSGARVVVARGRQIVFIKNIDIGGRAFDQAVAKRLNLPLEEASEMRLRAMHENFDARQQGENDTETRDGADSADPKRYESVLYAIRDAIRGDAEALAKEIGLCVRYCSVTFRGMRPQRVVLTGGEAYDSGLRELMTEYLGIECVIGRPLKGIDVSAVDFGGDRRGMLSEWAVCTGLALRCVDMPSASNEDDNEERRLSA